MPEYTIPRVKVCPVCHSPNFVSNDHLNDQELLFIIRGYKYLFHRFYCFDHKGEFFKPKEVNQDIIGHIYDKKLK